MATRTDVTVEFETDPRIAEVADPSTAITVQDTVDTLRKQEDQFTKGLPHPKLIDAAGKESLGGGVQVGITASLQNTQLAFEPRTTPAESGTVTTGSGTPLQSALGLTIDFVDNTADFVTANVAPGSLVINFTDRSIADVLRVDSATQLTTRILQNGVTNTYQVNDIYQVFNVVQCNIDGGNLVAVDEDDLEISPVLPTAFTQVVRSASSSATLIPVGGLSPTQQQIRDSMLLAPGGAAASGSIDNILATLPADTVAELNSTTYDGVTMADILQDLLSMAKGRIVESPAGTFTFYEQDNTTVRFVLIKSGNERTRS